MFLLAGINWSELVTTENINSAIRVIVLLGLGFPLLLFICAVVGKAVQKRFTPQASMLIRKGIFYFGSILLIVSVLYQLGFKLTALLGAAGIAGIAIGFASQTSVSNSHWLRFADKRFQYYQRAFPDFGKAFRGGGPYQG